MQDIILGDTLNFTTSVDGFLPSDGWTLAYRIIPRSGAGSAITLTGFQDSVDSSLHRIQATAGTTANWSAGAYSWHSYVTRASESYTVSTGSVTFIANPRTAGALDLRSDARIALDNVRAVLSGKASSGVLSYRIGERQLESYSISELLVLESRLLVRVKAEENAEGMAEGRADRRKIQVRMGRV